ncbi:MAG: hypothetical protein M3Q73_03700 [bacterium]|nr:hypothetical protein [bacterium]
MAIIHGQQCHHHDEQGHDCEENCWAFLPSISVAPYKPAAVERRNQRDDR